MTKPKNLEPLPKAPADQQLEPGGNQEAFSTKRKPKKKVPYSEGDENSESAQTER